MGFTHAEVAPCLFIKDQHTKLITITVYVDKINTFGIKAFPKTTITILKNIFEMNHLG